MADRLAQLTLDDFVVHRNETFQVSGGDAALAVLLIEANALGAASAGPSGRAPFSLVFRGPRDVSLEQRIHRLEHAELGVLELFLVPIGPDALGLRYEAIFG